MDQPLRDDEFLRQLETALGLDRAQALDTLGSWLTRYQPLGSYQLSFRAPPHLSHPSEGERNLHET